MEFCSFVLDEYKIFGMGGMKAMICNFINNTVDTNDNLRIEWNRNGEETHLPLTTKSSFTILNQL